MQEEEKKVSVESHWGWTRSGKLKLYCTDDECPGKLKYAQFEDLTNSIYQIDGLPKSIPCKGKVCTYSLRNGCQVFFCPWGIIKGHRHQHMVWCSSCACKMALEVHTEKVHFMNLSGFAVRFDENVIIKRFGSIKD